VTQDRDVAFSELRSDWYRGADLMARLIVRSAREGTNLTGFPAIWIPIFMLFGAQWQHAIPQPEWQPLFSDLPPREIERLARAAFARGQLRTLVEGTAALDPLLADVLHKLDRRRDGTVAVGGKIAFTGWQSYGRAEVLNFEDRIRTSRPEHKDAAILLPCARRRPYGRSKTHTRLWKGLAQMRVGKGSADEIVISSLGVIPQAFWEDPVVLAYDSGVPDIYRVLRIMRSYFGERSYPLVIDCLEFEPYRDCLRILQREGIIEQVLDGPARHIKKLPRP
jgi:predicted RNA-binding protein